MTETKQILENIIADFSEEKFIRFFREKSRRFAERQENPSHFNNEDFANGKKLGEIKFESGDHLIVCAFEVKSSLSERSGKKAQYEKAKEILKNGRNFSAGIFIFHDPAGNFRFSLVYKEVVKTGEGTIKSQISNFRRFTYFVSPDLTNKTFKHQIGEGDFSSLEKIKDAFSVEKVTKEFFGKVSNWYFWAVKNIVFPENAEKDKNNRNSIGVIRLITRIIFIWFMKEKKLIPDYLFNENKVKEFLKSLSPGKSDYYKAILQNLFFATLNTPIKKRGFRESENFQGKNTDFMNHSIYRYEDYFKNQKEIQKNFKDIPFLNGGLFECLDKEAEEKSGKKYLRIDGFSDRKDNALKVPNFLFFSEERNVDLNSDYGTKNKKYKIQGLINILQSYNFTIDENTLIDEEVALDPEMLGMVFENLLASYNPETSTTARKATGSYYTPRKIVDYMVDESLKAYLKNKLPETEKIDDKLNNLFSYSEEGHQFNNSEVDILIKAINRLKVIDPAVGSGAFPMGVLQKLVFVLSKLDPHNKKWKQEQIDAVENNVSDSVLKKELIKKIESNFENNELDYGRKLYLIQNCIYGVDIQITAIQISKLRFFISLLVDEKSNENKEENFGIESLPNLETKFVAANSLIGLYSSGAVMLPDPRILKLEEELKKIRAKHFNANHKSEKERLRKKDKEIRLQLAELFKQSGFPSENTEKIINWDPYSSNTSADFFDSEWMFGVEGFDIVIANPPYVRQEEISNKELLKKDYEIFNPVSDLYTYFYERGFKLLRDRGILTFITSNKFLRAQYGTLLRRHLHTKTTIRSIVNFESQHMFEAVTNTLIFIAAKGNDKNNKLNYSNSIEEPDKIKFSQCDLQDREWTIEKPEVICIKNKIEKMGTPLKDWDVKINYGIKTGFNEAFIINKETRDKIISENPSAAKIIKPIIRGRDIERYYHTKHDLYLINTHNGYKIDNSSKEEAIDIKNYPVIKSHLDQYRKKLVKRQDKGKTIYNLRDCAFIQDFSKEKIIWIELTNKNRFSYSDRENYLLAGAFFMVGESLKYLLAFLNSKLCYFYFSLICNSSGMATMQWKKFALEKVPVMKISKEQQKPFINLVDQILKNKKSNPKADTGELEREIDEMVYGLYGLNERERGIVENSSKK